MSTTDLLKALQETLIMSGWSMVVILLFGFLVGVLLFDLSDGGLHAAPKAYSVVSFVVNIFRAVPFAILIVLLLPVTKVLVGTIFGTVAIIPALSLSGIPFFARTVETALREVDRGLIEAGRAMGASSRQILMRIIVREALPSLIRSLTLTTISIVSYTSMAGLIGGGGLAYQAIRYGLYNNDMRLALFDTLILLVLVLGVQWLGETVSRKLNKK